MQQMTLVKSPIKEVVEKQYHDLVLKSIDSKFDTVISALSNLDILSRPRIEEKYITTSEWMARCKVSRWKYDVLRSKNLLRGKTIGRKFYVEISEVERFFAGELKLPD
jgi:hypothetical protein